MHEYKKRNKEKESEVTEKEILLFREGESQQRVPCCHVALQDMTM
jgi:hypothetical protein